MTSKESQTEKWDREKRVRRQLRGRQRTLLGRFMAEAPHLDSEGWAHLSGSFLSTLEEDERLETLVIDTERYLLAIYNLLSALGFRIHTGKVPRVSGTDREYGHTLFAFDKKRMVVVDGHPETLYATLADIQPLCPLPVLGLLYNNWVPVERPTGAWEYAVRSIVRSRRLAAALALGHFTFTQKDLKAALGVNPFTHPASLRKLAGNLGLTGFFSPPVDALPVFGQFVSQNHNLHYDVGQFLKDSGRTERAGASIATGDVTQASKAEAVADPEAYFRELRRAKLVAGRKGALVETTETGYNYLRSRVLPFPLGQLLHSTCLAARDEVRRAVQAGFMDALTTTPGSAGQDTTCPISISVEEFDSFSGVALVPPQLVTDKVPVTVSENRVKHLIHGILHDSFERPDWGGEQNDIFTSRVEYRGKRLLAAMLLKGPAVGGRLTIAKCGKNGDQIQRLFQSPANVFFIQFNGAVDERVIEEARQKANSLRAAGRSGVAFCIIDGIDTARLIMAYGKKHGVEM